MIGSQKKLSPDQVRTEIVAGITSFMATMYIIVVNPNILSQAGIPFSAACTATVMVSFISTFLMGALAKNPIVVAPGMGLNAFFTFTIVLGGGHDWKTALGAVFISGVIFLLITLFKLREYLANAIPETLRYAIAAGIGLFIAFIGLKNAGIIVKHPVTLVTLGPANYSMAVFFIGLILTGYLYTKKIKAALFLGIVTTTVLSLPAGRWIGSEYLVRPAPGATWIAAPDFSTFFALDVLGALKLSLIPFILSFVFTDLFDSLSTFIGVAEAGNLKDKQGNPKNLGPSLLVDSISTTISGLFGSSPGTSYIESASGISAGGKTGLTAIVAAALFLPFLFLSPMIGMVPALATAPALVLVGVFMMSPIIKIKWKNIDDGIPAFLSIIMIPLTFSISNGIIAGILTWSLLKALLGKKEDLNFPLLIIAIIALIMGIWGH